MTLTFHLMFSNKKERKRKREKERESDSVQHPPGKLGVDVDHA